MNQESEASPTAASRTESVGGEPPIRCERDARGIVTLTLNRPRAFNSLSEDLLVALQTELDALAGDASARVLVLTGAGQAFCAGHDVKELRAAPSPDDHQRLFRRCTHMMLTLRRLPIPVIARVQGIATAAGCQLVAQCDLAVASSEARFAVSGVKLGLFCSTPAVPLSRNVSRKQAFEMLVTGEFIDAAEAKSRGLVNRVAAPGELDAEVQKLAAEIIATPRATLALGKELFYRQAELDMEAAYEVATQTIVCNMEDEAVVEGLQAFLEKRPPLWADRR